MSRESLERVVLHKFKENYPEFSHIQEYATLCDKIKLKIESETKSNQDEIKKDYKKLLKSIKICDPAVGSGHFMAAVLNQMIKIYCYDLRLVDCLASKHIELKDDEFIIRGFAYEKAHKQGDEGYEIQKALFNLKKDIIENNLFGVDINPNSAEICKLRLWIELLKSSYYLQDGDEGYNPDFKDSHQMQTLPNIDINIKVGNSLISYIPINEPLFLQATAKIRTYQELEKRYFYGNYGEKEKIKTIKQDLKNWLN